MSDFLRVQEVDVCYGRAKVLHNVNLEMKEGEFLFIVGRNGAGKTTFLKTVAGFLKPANGSIWFEGKRISGLAPETIAHMGIRIVFQEKRVFSGLTVRENIAIAAYSFRENLKRAIDRVLSIYPKFSEFLDRKAGFLSGGQKQLLLIGRALIGEPRLLLIDEPTEGLAAVAIKEVRKVLEDMRGKVSLIVVEQRIPLVVEMADRLCVMKEGKLCLEMTREELLAHKDRLERIVG